MQIIRKHHKNTNEHFFCKFSHKRERFTLCNHKFIEKIEYTISIDVQTIFDFIKKTKRIHSIFLTKTHQHKYHRKQKKNKKIIFIHDDIVNNFDNIIIFIDENEIKNEINTTTI